MVNFLMFYSGVLLTVWGQPTLYPLSIHACPNVTVTYYCHDSQIIVIRWEVPPYIPEDDPIQYVVDPPGGIQTIHVNREDKFFANLTNIMRLNGSVADMTTSLTIITYGIENKTNITCRVATRDFQALKSSSTLYLTGIPDFKAPSITYQEKETYFTAVLELGDMFDGGGVPIDHYIIQVDNGTQLETPGPTYSFYIMYNTTLSVNISAHNCAGYSDPLPLEIQYDQDSMEKDMPSMTPGLERDMPSMTPGLERDMPNVTPRLKDKSPKPDGSPSGPSVPLVAGIAAAVILLVFLACFLTTVVIFFKLKKQFLVQCDVVDNSAYDVHVRGSAGDRLEPDYNMENNPLYEMRILSNEGHSHKTQTPAPVPVYESVDL